MARDIQGRPQTLEEAIYLLDRGKLPRDLRTAVRGAKTREQAVHRLTDEFDPDEGGDDEEIVTDYAEWKNDDLREELEKRGLPNDGNKGELVERLEADDDGLFDEELEDEDEDEEA